jgi:DNA-binding transcriptional regulator YiaG
VFVHRLVMLAFVGPCPAGHEVRHINGDPSDNRLVNLRYGTRSENQKDRARHERTKLTPANVKDIRRRLKRCESQYSIAARFNVNQSLISRIKTGEAYSDV